MNNNLENIKNKIYELTDRYPNSSNDEPCGCGIGVGLVITGLGLLICICNINFIGLTTLIIGLLVTIYTVCHYIKHARRFNYKKFNPTMPISFDKVDDFDDLYNFIHKNSDYKYSTLINNKEKETIKQELDMFEKLLFKNDFFDFSNTEMENLHKKIILLKETESNDIIKECFNTENINIDTEKLSKEIQLLKLLTTKTKNTTEINKFELYKKQIKKYWNQNLLVNIGDENYLFVNKLLNNEININSIELFDIKLIKRNQYNPIIN